MPIRGRHPRHVNDPPVGVGDVVNSPEHGPITVGAVGKRYFSGQTESGERFGDTSMGLVSGESMRGDAEPWSVEKRRR
jgi:hypothetical protein